MNYSQVSKWGLLGLVLVIYLCSAYFSAGYYHPDEFFQIITFSQKITADLPDKFQPWEYAEQMRPSIQPWIYAALTKLFHSLGYGFVSMISRFLALSLFAFSIYIGFKRVSNIKLYVALLVLLFWFIPQVSIRFSSENISGSLLLIGILTWPTDSSSEFKKYLIPSFVLGLAMVVRLQVAAGIAPFLLLSIYQKKSIKILLPVALGIALSQFIGILLDYLFYGEFTLTSWNYFKVNLIDGVAGDRYGTSSFHFYFKKLINSRYIIPFVLLTSALVYKLKNDRFSPVSCLVISFILVHSFIGHKELRFLFPLIPLSIILIAEFASKYNMAKYVLVIFTAIGIPYVLISSINPMYAPIIIFEKLEFEPGSTIGYIKDNPENLYCQNQFYYQDRLHFLDLTDTSNSQQNLQYIYGDRNQVLQYFNEDELETKFQYYPEWLITYFNFYDWADNTQNLGFYKIKHLEHGRTQ